MRLLFHDGVALTRNKSTLLTLSVAAALIILGAAIFYLRYPFAYEYSNFYAEDGSHFMTTLLEKGIIEGSLTLFNGYLVIGQYAVGALALLINWVAGDDFVTLAKAVALASYVTLAGICVLPWLLFRKRLGTTASLIAVFLLWLTPFGSYDFAIIGTLGNLKFAFLFMATLLVIYRNDPLLCDTKAKTLLTDLGLLVCLLTNVVAVALLPFALLRYRTQIMSSIHQRRLPASILTLHLISLLVAMAVALLYVAVVLLKGIPHLEGYLDGQGNYLGLPIIIYRSTFYAVMYPVTYLLAYPMAAFGIAAICLIATALLLKKRILFTATGSVVVVALVLNVAGFVVARPGVTSVFATLNERAWPGQFFYAGTMIAIFGAICIIAPKVQAQTKYVQVILIVCTVAGGLVALPAAGFTKTDPYNSKRPTLASEVNRICSVGQLDDDARIDIYPTEDWSMALDKRQVCD